MCWSWGGFFDVANREAKSANDKQLSLSPGFWDDNARATAILKEIKVHEYWINLYNVVETAVEDFAPTHRISIPLNTSGPPSRPGSAKTSPLPPTPAFLSAIHAYVIVNCYRWV